MMFLHGNVNNLLSQQRYKICFYKGEVIPPPFSALNKLRVNALASLEGGKTASLFFGKKMLFFL